MRLKCAVMLLWVICLSYKVVMTGGKVVWVNRNVTDSFRVGKDGCTNDTSVCTHQSTCQLDGSCLCTLTGEPNFRNPDIISDGVLKYGDSYGCASNHYLRLGVDDGPIYSYCSLGPLQLIPYSDQDPATKFSDIDSPDTVFKSCSLKKALAKFPDNATEMELQWLNGFYVDFTVRNETLDFKWKRTVLSLRGTIITLHLLCSLQYPPATGIPKCLRAKVLGIWPADAVFVTPEPTVTSKQPKSSQITSEATSFVTVTTAEPKSTVRASSDGGISDSSKVFIALFSISVVVNVALGIVVLFLWKKMQRNQDNDFKIREMQNIDEQRRANTGNEISTYDEVVTDSGMRNDGLYDESFPSSGHNNNEHLSDHKYEEPSNYEPLRRNHLQDQSDEHNYQSLTTSQKGK